MKYKLFNIVLITTLVLYALSMKRAMETGAMDGSMLLCLLPMIVWFFIFSVKDYIEYDRAEREKREKIYRMNKIRKENNE